MPIEKEYTPADIEGGYVHLESLRNRFIGRLAAAAVIASGFVAEIGMQLTVIDPTDRLYKRLIGGTVTALAIVGSLAYWTYSELGDFMSDHPELAED